MVWISVASLTDFDTFKFDLALKGHFPEPTIVVADRKSNHNVKTKVECMRPPGLFPANADHSKQDGLRKTVETRNCWRQNVGHTTAWG